MKASLYFIDMKSKKAEEFIQSLGGDEYYLCKYDYQVLKQAVELAEKEMREKAIEAHFNSCSHLYDRNCKVSNNGICEYRSGGKCEYMNKFIEELKNK